MDHATQLLIGLYSIKSIQFYQQLLNKDNKTDVFIENLKKERSKVKALAEEAVKLDKQAGNSGIITAQQVIEKINTNSQSKDIGPFIKLKFVLSNFFEQLKDSENEIEQFTVCLVYNTVVHNYLKQIPDEKESN